jgi:hypothetical protein
MKFIKILIRSAFALSLALHVEAWAQDLDNVTSFLGLDEEVAPDLMGPQRFTTERLHENTEWRVRAEEVEIDKQPLKGQGYSIIPWKDQSPEEFLNIHTWIFERGIKDKDPDWKVRTRNLRHVELMGKFLSCVGKCSIYRGNNKAKVNYLSRVFEGDEIQIGTDSYAWIYLMDGTLARLASDTSVNFQEINFSKEKVFVLLRLNHGHVFWHPRNTEELLTDTSPETDGGSLPLNVREANQQFFERARYQDKRSEWSHLIESSSLDESAIKDQFKKINELRAENKKFKDTKSHVMLVAPNVTVVSQDTSFDLLYILAGKSFVKKRTTRDGDELALQMRGYLTSAPVTVSDLNWVEISETGRDQVALSDPPGPLQVTELMTKRIKTLELARELWFKKSSMDILESLSDAKKLAIDHGYVLWEKGMSQRFDFLSEYTRRIETTNLRSVENLLKRSETDSKKLDVTLNDTHYRASLNDYLKGLKTRYTDKKMEIREMNDLQYYVWILKHGKFKN